MYIALGLMELLVVVGYVKAKDLVEKSNIRKVITH
ncbi:hypothetical protein SAMN04489761_2955 [Tenacibaculum sp. MAR_2009_124]|nr:hypothetical protein SAMN04489761_2955 [Tenacibaculum sp. MAR_2009_124]